MSRPPILVVGYGSAIRSDDAAGPEVVERLGRLGLPGVECLAAAQLAPEVAAAVAGRAAVYFVDARRADGRGVLLDPLEPRQAGAWRGHFSDPAAILTLAAAAFEPAAEAWLVTVPGYDFAVGVGLSPFTSLHVGAAVRMLAALAA